MALLHRLLDENALIAKYEEYIGNLSEAPISAAGAGRSVGFSDRSQNQIRDNIEDVLDCLHAFNPSKYPRESVEEIITHRQTPC